eukprot:TRINITY_DN11401_c0_g1_i1.p1 TRINITY_DN11401_c0_g1~~TRINITY_DN11401_c0_g1_i1.p1  ORF type:complete len:1504 (+),score=330.80 TRINITY_DN11401_c0_g1_i1:68-4579(+)
MAYYGTTLKERQEAIFQSVKAVEDLMRSISSQSKDHSTLLCLKALLDEIRELRPEATIPPYTFLNAFVSSMEAKKGRLLLKILKCGQKLVENEVLCFNQDISFRPNNPMKPGSFRQSPQDSSSASESAIMNLDDVVDMMCSCRKHHSEEVVLELVKFLGTLVSSHSCTIHDYALMRILHTCYAVRLTPQKQTNIQQIARTTLMQTVQCIHDRLDEGYMMRKSVRLSEVIRSTLPQDDAETVFSFGKERETDETVILPMSEPDMTESLEDDSLMTPTAICEKIVRAIVSDAINKAEGKSSVSSPELQHNQFRDEFSVSNEPYIRALSPSFRDACNIIISFCRILIRQPSKEEAERNRNSEELTLEDQGKILAYEALFSIIEKRDDVLSRNPAFVKVLKQYVCQAVMMTSVSSNATFFHYSLNFMYLLIEKFRIHLKAEIGIVLSHIYLRLLESPNTPDGHKIKIIQVLNRMCKNENLIVELFLNYDINIVEDNLFLRLVDVLTKVARGSVVKLEDPDSQGNFEQFGLQALVDILLSMVKWCKIGYTSPDQFPPEITESHANLPRDRESCIKHFEDMKRRKVIFEKGIETFNSKPGKGIKHLVDHNMLENTHSSIATFLRETSLLDKTKVGEYLGEGEDFNIAVLKEYVEGISFADMTFDGALRYYLCGFRLPGEAQKISRMLEIFTNRFCHQNPAVFSSAETAYVLSYSVIMLNTDAHNPMVKKKMSLEEFIRNNRGIDNGKDLPQAFLESLYKEIVKNEIKMKDTDEPKIASSLNSTKRKTMLFEWEGDRILSKCEDILAAKLRLTHQSYLLASYIDIPRLMFGESWYSFLGVLSQAIVSGRNLQSGLDLNRIGLVTEGFKLAIKLSVKNTLEVETSAFVAAYLKLLSGHDTRNGVKLGEDSPSNSEGRFNPLEGPVVDEKYMKEYFPSASRMGRAEMSRLQENLEKLAGIQKMCVGQCKEKVFDPMRRFVREGDIEYITDAAPKKRHLFLFNDSFLLATTVPNKITSLYFFHKMLLLSETSITLTPSDVAGSNLMLDIKNPRQSFRIKLASEEHKRVWFEDISKAISASHDKESTESDSKAPLPSHLVATSCLHFDCKKEDKQKGNFKKRIIQIDYASQKVNVAKKGVIHKVFTFADLEDCSRDATNPFIVDARFRGPELYKIKLPSEKDADDMYAAVRNVIDLNPHSIPPQFKLSDCVKRGNCEKLGNRAWSLRWLLLYRKKLFIFKTAQDIFPVNILSLSENLNVLRGEDLTLEVKDASREYSLRFKSKPEREGWIAALQEASSDGGKTVSNPLLLTCVNSVNVSVVKLNKRGVSQTRIIQVDFQTKRLNNILDGSIRKCWPLSEIAECQVEGMTCLRIFFKDFHRYEVFLSTPQDFKELQWALQIAKTNPSQALPAELLPGSLVRRGYVELQSGYSWLPRMTYLFDKRLFMFQNDFEQLPTTVVQMRDVKNIMKLANTIIDVTFLKKSISLKFESEAERDSWYSSLSEVRRKHANSSPS